MILNVMEYLRGFPNQVKISILVVLALIIFSLIVGHKVNKILKGDVTKKLPLWLIPIMWLIDLINNFTKQNIGKRWKTYAPYFTALGFFIFISNIAGIFGVENPTSYIMINAALAVITFFIVQITGIVSLGIVEYLKSFVGPVKPMAFIMIPINIISEITLPISLTLRLLGNIISGAVIGIIIKGLLGWIAIPILPFINAMFDIGFGAIQAFVFVILTIIFTSMKVDDSEKIYD